jgi:hypothetical protein
MREFRNTILMLLLLIFVLSGLQGVVDFFREVFDFLTRVVN